MSPAHINKQIMARLEAIEKILAEVAAKLDQETTETAAAKRGPGRPPKAEDK